MMPFISTIIFRCAGPSIRLSSWSIHYKESQEEGRYLKTKSSVLFFKLTVIECIIGLNLRTNATRYVMVEEFAIGGFLESEVTYVKKETLWINWLETYTKQAIRQYLSREWVHSKWDLACQKRFFYSHETRA